MRTIPQTGVHMFDLKEGMCAWVIGDPRNSICCGLPVSKGSYCADHARVCFNEREPRDVFIGV